MPAESSDGVFICLIGNEDFVPVGNYSINSKISSANVGISLSIVPFIYLS